jgi:cell division initiation protein
MIDLTPLDVRKKKGDFRRVMRGYDAAAVDDFLDVVADRLEQLVRDSQQHDERVGRLEEQVREYRDRERALTEALVTAQQMREEVREQATREADIARREAETEAAKIRQAAKRARSREEELIRQLRDRKHQLLASYRALLEREIAELNALMGTLDADDAATLRDHGLAGGGFRAGRPDAEASPGAAPPVPPLEESVAADESGGGKLFDAADLESVFDFDVEPPRCRAAAEPSAAAGEAADEPEARAAPRDGAFRFAFEDEQP